MNDVVLRERAPKTRKARNNSHLGESCAQFAKHAVDVAFRPTATDERGQGLAEYGLILGLIAILVVVAVLFLSGNIQGLLSNVGNSI
jgi:Flp pilus assembly pilin Flp